VVLVEDGAEIGILTDEVVALGWESLLDVDILSCKCLCAYVCVWCVCVYVCVYICDNMVYDTLIGFVVAVDT